MGNVRVDLKSGQVIQIGDSQSVDPRLRFLLKTDYVSKNKMVAVLQVPEVRDSLLSVARSGAKIDEKVLHEAIKPVYDICMFDRKAARAKGYPAGSIGNCYRKLDALVNPSNVTYAGPISDLNGVKFFTKDAATGDILEVKLKK